MAGIQLTCPHCGATLNFAQGVQAGAALPCLICNRTFTVRAATTAQSPAQAAPPRATAAVSAAPSQVGVPSRTAPAATAAPRSMPRRKTPADSQSASGGGGAGRAVVGLALVALALVMVGGLAYALWTFVLADRFARDSKDAPLPSFVQAPKDKSQLPAPAKDADLPPKTKDAGAKDAGVKDTGAIDLGAKDASAKEAGKNDGGTNTGVKPSTDGDDDVGGLVKKDKLPDKPPIVGTQPKIRPDEDKPRKDDKPPPTVEIVVPAPVIAPGVDAKRIDAAIAHGVEYLKKGQQADGSWASQQYPLGYACLAGLALLECQVPANSDSMRKIADLVRSRAGELDDTYQAALAILFLDRIGDVKDRPIIRAIALRMMLGQMDSGAWAYNFPRASEQDMQPVDAFLKTHFPWSPAQPRPNTAVNIPANKDKNGKKDEKPLKGPPIDLRKLPVDQLTWARGFNRVPALGFGDNSNTQFALLALWAARRHDVPAECPLLLSYQHFLSTQTANGGWAYNVREPQATHTMTCAGLLGMAMGPGAVPGGSLAGAGKLEDPAIQRGLEFLGGYIGNPSPDPQARPAMQNLYFLWSVERVGVLYDLKTIGGKDWYGWGAQILVANQQGDGSWTCGNAYTGASAHLDTCFALLFLKRANLVADLTENLRLRMVIRDPSAK